MHEWDGFLHNSLLVAYFLALVCMTMMRMTKPITPTMHRITMILSLQLRQYSSRSSFSEFVWNSLAYAEWEEGYISFCRPCRPFRISSPAGPPVSWCPNPARSPELWPRCWLLPVCPPCWGHYTALPGHWPVSSWTPWYSIPSRTRSGQWSSPFPSAFRSDRTHVAQGSPHSCRLRNRCRCRRGSHTRPHRQSSIFLFHPSCCGVPWSWMPSRWEKEYFVGISRDGLIGGLLVNSVDWDGSWEAGVGHALDVHF